MSCFQHARPAARPRHPGGWGLALTALIGCSAAAPVDPPDGSSQSSAPPTCLDAPVDPALTECRKRTEPPPDAGTPRARLGTLVPLQAGSGDPNLAGPCLQQSARTKLALAKKGFKPLAIAELQRQREVQLDAQRSSPSEKEKRACASETAALMLGVAAEWHLEAVGSADVRGTNDPETMQLAEGLYDFVLASVAELDALAFPRIAERDWPSVAHVHYAKAALLQFQKKWPACAAAFDALIALEPEGALAAAAETGATLCYQSIYVLKHHDGSHRTGIQHRAGASYEPKPLSEEEAGMVGAFTRAICQSAPSKDLAELEFARARVYFEAQQWPEAAAAFRGVAFSYADVPAGAFAAQLYLESLDVMAKNVKEPRPACASTMQHDAPQLLELHCQGKALAESAQPCAAIRRSSR